MFDLIYAVLIFGAVAICWLMVRGCTHLGAFSSNVRH
ncbi:hypothetical protein ABIE64_002181 [Thalassospira sp. MBR-102]